MSEARLNTQIAFIPFLSTQAGQNVLNSTPADKQFVVRASFVGRTQQDKDIGIPAPIYAENILPTAQGWDSVTYTEKIRGIPSTRFDQLINLKSGTENNILYSPSQGRDYINYNGAWQEGPYSQNFAGMVTSAYTRLRSFICYQRQKVMEYDFSSKSFSIITLTGLEIAAIDGITAANNAMVAWNETTIFWSSFNTPTDFTPSLSSGAGSQNPTQVRGKIVTCLPIADGFIIYTTANAIAATWSGNIRYPWKFTEIPGSSGVLRPEHVTYESTMDGHFAWTLDGLQLVTKKNSQQVYSEITDFLAGKLVEEYIGPTEFHAQNSADSFSSETQTWSSSLAGPQLLQQFHLKTQPWVKLCLISSRFLIVSYGYRTAGIYDWCIVYDLVLERYGKLKIPHVDAFAYVTQAGEAPTAKETIGFLAQDGAVSVVDFSLMGRGTGILIYGKLQSMQGRWIEALSLTLQTVRDCSPALIVVPTYDGVNSEAAVVPLRQIETRNVIKWLSRVAGQNISLVISGTFSISSLVFEYNQLGTR